MPALRHRWQEARTLVPGIGVCVVTTDVRQSCRFAVQVNAEGKGPQRLYRVGVLIPRQALTSVDRRWLRPLVATFIATVTRNETGSKAERDGSSNDCATRVPRKGHCPR